MTQREYPFYDYCVQPHEVDLTKRATIITLGDMLLHAAGADADRIGFGVATLQEAHTTWVLSRMAIEMERFPREYEACRIGTWVGEINRLMTVRNMVIEDEQGHRLGAACTCWAMIDMASRHALDLTKNVHYSKTLLPYETPVGKPLRIARVDGREVDQHRVRYSDIDFNQHTNTMKYIQWMVDTLPLERLTEGKMRRLDINFLHETRFGDSVRILHAADAQSDRFELLRFDDATPVCRALFEWSL